MAGSWVVGQFARRSPPAAEAAFIFATFMARLKEAAEKVVTSAGSFRRR